MLNLDATGLPYRFSKRTEPSHLHLLQFSVCSIWWQQKSKKWPVTLFWMCFPQFWKQRLNTWKLCCWHLVFHRRWRTDEQRVLGFLKIWSLNVFLCESNEKWVRSGSPGLLFRWLCKVLKIWHQIFPMHVSNRRKKKLQCDSNVALFSMGSFQSLCTV